MSQYLGAMREDFSLETLVAQVRTEAIEKRLQDVEIATTTTENGFRVICHRQVADIFRSHKKELRWFHCDIP